MEKDTAAINDRYDRTTAPERDHIPITPQTLYQDNHSPKADEERIESAKIKTAGRKIVRRKCSDSRYGEDSKTSLIDSGSINVSAPQRPYQRLLMAPYVEGAINEPHYDSEELRRRGVPAGCGGSHAREAFERESVGVEEINSDDLKGYISQIEHPDIIINGLRKSQETAHNTPGRPIFLTARDHRTQLVIPVAMHFNEGIMTRSFVPTVLMANLRRNYDPKAIYAGGTLPAIPEDVLPDFFREYLKTNREYAGNLVLSRPHIMEETKIQSPAVIEISTLKESFQPFTLDGIGKTFRIMVARDVVEEGENGINRKKMVIPPSLLRPSLQQVEYPFLESISHHDQPGTSFHTTRTVFIQTPFIDESKQIADAIKEKPLTKVWLKQVQGQIIIAQTKNGIISDIARVA